MKQNLEIGSILNNRYEIISNLGSGGMSNVYLVEDIKLKTRWALKEMIDNFIDENKTDLLEQFKKEAQILASMKHPNLPRVFDYFDEGGKHYLVMEYIEGLTLEEILERNENISPHKIRNWMIQVCDVLDNLHKQNIIYRDLKPSNLMVDKNNRIYIIDFGIARLYKGDKRQDTVIIGTPGFASPEHHGHSQTDARSDIYSLGATFHYLSTRIDPRHMPFIFQSPQEIIPDFPPDLSRIIMKAVELKPEDRFQSAPEMKRELEKGSITPITTQPLSSSASALGVLPPSTPLLEKTFNSDPIKSYTPSALISAGISLGTALMVTGFSLSPITAGISLGGTLLLLYPVKKAWNYVFKTPRTMGFRINPQGMIIKKGDSETFILWNEVEGLLEFQEKVNFNLFAKKYKIFTDKGNFEYNDDIKGLQEINDTIIYHAGLSLMSESPGYKRYGKNAVS